MASSMATLLELGFSQAEVKLLADALFEGVVARVALLEAVELPGEAVVGMMGEIEGLEGLLRKIQEGLQKREKLDFSELRGGKVVCFPAIKAMN